MRRMLVTVVVCAWLSVACGGGSTDTAESGDRVDATPTTESSAVTTTSAARGSSSGYGTVATTTTVPTASESALDPKSIVEKVGVDTRFERTSVNGTVYPNGLVIEPLPYRTEWRIEIDAGRDYTRFRGDLGITDDQPSSTFYRVEIVLDNGSPALSAEVRFGETKTIDLDVTNVLRIRIVLTPNGYGKIALGNPRLIR